MTYFKIFDLKLLIGKGKKIDEFFQETDLAAPIEQDEIVFEEGEVYNRKGRNYFRIDLGVRVHFFKEKVEHVISLDVQNFSNRLNQWHEIYNSETKAIEEYPMADLIPILNYKIVF